LAVLCSLVVHAFILVLLSQIKESTRARAAPPPMTARLAKPRPLPEPPVVAPPSQLPVTRAVPDAKPQARPIPTPIPPPQTPVVSFEPPKQAAEPALVVPAAPPAPVARVEAQPLPAAASGPDPASVARYRLELMEIAARYERYPRIARENDWEGRIDLLVAFAENGAIASMTVKKSTGRAVLDEEAQAMIRSAQPHTVVPPALRGRAFALETAVIFRLKK
jgi:TonB family protein